MQNVNTYFKPATQGVTAHCELTDVFGQQASEISDECCVSGWNLNGPSPPEPRPQPPPNWDQRMQELENWGSRVCNEPGQQYTVATSPSTHLTVKCLGSEQQAPAPVAPLSANCDLDATLSNCVLDARRKFLAGAIAELRGMINWPLPPGLAGQPGWNVPRGSPADDLSKTSQIIDASTTPVDDPCNEWSASGRVVSCYGRLSNSIFLLALFWQKAQVSPIIAIGVLIHELRHRTIDHNCPTERAPNGAFLALPVPYVLMYVIWVLGIPSCYTCTLSFNGVRRSNQDQFVIN